jgi:RNA polymerase sigma-70 factor (ECF subfamily)
LNVTVIGSASAVSPEERALRTLYLEHGPAVYAYVLRLLGGDTHRTEDILQETLLRCWNKKTLADGDGMAIRPWLFRVARNLVVDAHRTRAARPTEISDDSWLSGMPSEVDDIDRLLSSVMVRDALRSLTPAHREALHETVFADRTTRQAAEALGVPQGTVKSRVYYALRSLKTVLTDDAVR